MGGFLKYLPIQNCLVYIFHSIQIELKNAELLFKKYRMLILLHVQLLAKPHPLSH